MIIFVFLFAKFYFKRIFYRHHILGVCMVIIGLATVGFFAIMASKKNTTGDQVEMFGIILLLIA